MADHVTFGTGSGGKQTLVFDGVEFLGYGLPSDYEGRNLKGKLIVTVPNLAPAPAQQGIPAVPGAPAAPALAGEAREADRPPDSRRAQPQHYVSRRRQQHRLPRNRRSLRR